MKVTIRQLVMVSGVALLLLMGASYEAHAQGRGRGGNWDKKCEKFVNCHDASEGRVDGRGPRRSDYWNSSRFRRTRDYDSAWRRHHRRDSDRQGQWRRDRDRTWTRRNR